MCDPQGISDLLWGRGWSVHSRTLKWIPNGNAGHPNSGYQVTTLRLSPLLRPLLKPVSLQATSCELHVHLGPCCSWGPGTVWPISSVWVTSVCSEEGLIGKMAQTWAFPAGTPSSWGQERGTQRWGQEMARQPVVWLVGRLLADSPSLDL